MNKGERALIAKERKTHQRLRSAHLRSNSPVTALLPARVGQENVFEELDAPGEFFLDREAGKLYLMPNATTSISEDLRLAVLPRMIEVKGEANGGAVVENITISGLGLRDSAATYLGADWSAPSGGDWALHRGGALFIEHARGINVTRCRFKRLDGNALFLSRFTRDVSIELNEFEWIGENAIATWGETSGYDATEGAQPRFTTVQLNIMRELGLWQKQSSAWAQAKSCHNTVRRNLMFNMPRAAINFNDNL